MRGCASTVFSSTVRWRTSTTLRVGHIDVKAPRSPVLLVARDADNIVAADLRARISASSRSRRRSPADFAFYPRGERRGFRFWRAVRLGVTPSTLRQHDPFRRQRVGKPAASGRPLPGRRRRGRIPRA